jgi:ATP-dependent Clp endopeptidase proteolytic subunit ClpP
MAPVNPQSATALFKVLDHKIISGVRHIHLMLSSPGGSVFHGMSIFNFLRGAPIQVTTYNFGSVDSIGVVIYCAGSKRVTVPHSRFLIHGVSMNFQGNHSFDEKDLDEKLKGLKIDYRNISRVIADTTGRNVETIINDMETRTTLNPDEAVEYGLVHEVRSELFPLGADLTVINEDISVAHAVPQAVQFPLPFHVQHFTAPAIESFTCPSNQNTGT